jgi:hypothetical protein
MLRTIDDSTNFLIRYLWTAYVLALVVGGLVVAISRDAGHRSSIDGATLAGHSTSFMR